MLITVILENIILYLQIPLLVFVLKIVFTAKTVPLVGLNKVMKRFVKMILLAHLIINILFMKQWNVKTYHVIMKHLPIDTLHKLTIHQFVFSMIFVLIQKISIQNNSMKHIHSNAQQYVTNYGSMIKLF